MITYFIYTYEDDAFDKPKLIGLFETRLNMHDCFDLVSQVFDAEYGIFLRKELI